MKFDKEKMRLYAITDRHWLNGRSLKEVVKESLDGGVTFLQLRDKNSDDETFLQEAAELQELCRDYKVPLIINDNVEIALKMNADGVHVGQSDMEAGAVREKLGPDKILGVSARTVEQALLAGVIPYIPGDLVKIILVVLAGPIVKKRLQSGGFLL